MGVRHQRTIHRALVSFADQRHSYFRSWKVPRPRPSRAGPAPTCASPARSTKPQSATRQLVVGVVDPPAVSSGLGMRVDRTSVRETVAERGAGAAGTAVAHTLATSRRIAQRHARHSGHTDVDAQRHLRDGFDFDVKRIEPLLAEGTRVGWTVLVGRSTPPARRWRVSLPAWTNRVPDWGGEVGPTLRLAGESP